ncbi:hypothetical protein M5K25_001105 [Dendrobium thyrsiflorum]|uniref:RRM domain-containing protein n=1 Tax=Dendrobium thyrsiflorum TaxID=117978 RepID=A0ABD0VWK1_DENTH
MSGLRWLSGRMSGIRWWSGRKSGVRWWSGRTSGLRWWSGRTSCLRWWSGRTSGLRWWSGGTRDSGGGPVELRRQAVGRQNSGVGWWPGGGSAELRRWSRRSKEARAISDLSLGSLFLESLFKRKGGFIYRFPRVAWLVNSQPVSPLSMFLGARVPSKVALLSARRLFSRDSSNKLFVGGLSYDTNETILRDAFSTHGVVTQAKVICDRRSGKSKGFGFVQFSQESEAATALQKMDEQLLEGRNIRVCYANKE